MEQQNLHDLSLAAPDETTRCNLALTMIQTPLSVWNCPSRRQAAAFPVRSNRNWLANTSRPADLNIGWFRADYKCNGGSNSIGWGYGPGDWATAADSTPGRNGWLSLDDVKRCNGINYQRSKIRLAEITDGVSNTYMVGEKYLLPEGYYTGTYYADNEPVLGADDLDLHGWTNSLPYQDTPGYDNVLAFGSAHANGFNMAFCDGSVQTINYSIDPTVHLYLGCRNDDQSIDAKKVL